MVRALRRMVGWFEIFILSPFPKDFFTHLHATRTKHIMFRSVIRSRAAALTIPRNSLRFYSSADGNPPVMSQIREGLKSAMKSGNNTE